MAPFKDHEVTVEFTVTREYTYTDSADVVAKALGIKTSQLRRIVVDGEDLDEDNLAPLVDLAELSSEDFTLDVIESEEP